jgi:hypothetical protein
VINFDGLHVAKAECDFLRICTYARIDDWLQTSSVRPSVDVAQKVDRPSIGLKVDTNIKEYHHTEPVCLRFCKGISSSKSRRSEITYHSPDVTTGGSTVSCWEVVQHQLVVDAYDYARDTRPTSTSTQVILNADSFLFSQKDRKIIISFQSVMTKVTKLYSSQTGTPVTDLRLGIGHA